MAAWLGWVEAHAKLVMALAVLLTAAMLALSATTIRINTDTEDMLAPELSFRQLDKEQRAAFPQYSDIILVVLDGADGDATADAAAELSRRLAAHSELFRTVFYPAADPFFRKNGLLYSETEELAEMSDRIAAAQGLLARLASDVSLRGFFGVLGLAMDQMPADGADTETLARLIDRMAEVAVAQYQEVPGALSWRDTLRGAPASPGERRQLILVQPALDRDSLQPAADAIAELRRLAADMNLAGQGISLRLTGSAALEQEELKTVEQNMGLIGLMSFVLVAGLLFVGLRSWRLGLATLATLVIGLVWTAGFAALAVGHLNLLSVAFAVLFIGLSVDFGIHYGLRAKEGVDHGGDSRIALTRAGESVGGALALSALTAAIGFVSFVPTAYVGLAELGIISAGGMVIALFANLTVLPALLTLMPLQHEPDRRSTTVALAAAGRRTIDRHAGKIAAFAVGLGLAAAATLPFARFDFDPMNLRDPGAESVRTLLDLMADSHTNPYAITVLARDLDHARSLEQRLERLPEVRTVVGIDDMVPAEQDEKLDVVASLASMLTPVLVPEPAPPPSPAERQAAWSDFTDSLFAAAAQGPLSASAARLVAALELLGGGHPPRDATLVELERRLLGGLPGRLDELRESLGAEAFGLADLPQSLKRRMIAGDGRVRLQVVPGADMRSPDNMRAFIAAVRSVAPQATGAPIVIMEAGDTVVTAFWQASATALAIIVALLLVILRSLRDTLLVLTPLSIAALMLVATSVLLDLPFNFANVIVLPLLFGLGVANGIHFVMRSRGMGGGEAGAVLETSTPRAMVFSALTTIASFGSLALSAHKGTASMGILLTLAIGYTLLATLVVLPTMAKWLGRRRAA